MKHAGGRLLAPGSSYSPRPSHRTRGDSGHANAGFVPTGFPAKPGKPGALPLPKIEAPGPTQELLAAKRASCGQGPVLGSELPVTAAHPRGTLTLFRPRSDCSSVSRPFRGGLPDRGVPPTWPIARDVTPGLPGSQVQIRSRVAEREKRGKG